MWRTFKLLLLLWPIPVMAFLFINNMLDKANVDAHFSDTTSITWGSDQQQVKVSIKKTTIGEQDTYVITVLDHTGQLLSKQYFIVDKDMYGGGFVKAMQADGDQEQEIMAWSIHTTQKNFLLDYSKGQVTRKSFEKLPQETQDLCKQWYNAHIQTGLSLAFVSMGFMAYYILVAVVWLIVKAIRLFRSKGATFIKPTK